MWHETVKVDWTSIVVNLDALALFCRLANRDDWCPFGERTKGHAIYLQKPSHPGPVEKFDQISRLNENKQIFNKMASYHKWFKRLCRHHAWVVLMWPSEGMLPLSFLSSSCFAFSFGLTAFFRYQSNANLVVTSCIPSLHCVAGRKWPDLQPKGRWSLTCGLLDIFVLTEIFDYARPNK